MIPKITNDSRLEKYTRHRIEDAGIEVEVEETLTENEYIGIKVDDYYMGLKLQGETPKAVDYIVAVDCDCDNYALYIMEFKNTRSPGEFTSSSVREKFDTAINRFMKKDFKEIFDNDRFKYKGIKLYLVTTAYRDAMKYGNYEEYVRIKKIVENKDTLRNDLYLSVKPFYVRGHLLRIQREIPPNPIIRKIH